MRDGIRARRVQGRLNAIGPTVVIAGAVLLAGCASVGTLGMGEGTGPQAAAVEGHPQAPESELEKATEYWGKEYAKNPADGTAVVNYVKNLKAMGRKKEALAILQQTHAQNTRNREHLSEYGRLALEFGQVSTAKALLERADDPAKPDWRVVSARGTVLANEGRYKEAIAYFERANQLAPGQASVLNNLAMAHAMNGEAAKAETLLRQAADAEGYDNRVRQNLALVLDVQGKHGEAKTAAGSDLSDENARANVEVLRKAVRMEPKGAPAGTSPKSSAIAQAPSTDEKSTSHVATASITASDPEHIISAALRAEAAKNNGPR